MGNIYPDVVGGLNSTFRYKGFNLSVLLDYSFGATLFSWPNYAMKGTGTTIESLYGRTEEYGGVSYYINGIGQNIPWSGEVAPAESVDGLIYHDGIILEGVQEDQANPNSQVYTINEEIVSAFEYYNSNYVFWTGTQHLNAVDDKYKNDYIKLREISLSYKLPRKFVRKFGMKKASINLFARNLGYH